MFQFNGVLGKVRKCQRNHLSTSGIIHKKLFIISLTISCKLFMHLYILFQSILGHLPIEVIFPSSLYCIVSQYFMASLSFILQERLVSVYKVTHLSRNINRKYYIFNFLLTPTGDVAPWIRMHVMLVKLSTHVSTTPPQTPP